jgi:hypothetical protein
MTESQSQTQETMETINDGEGDEYHGGQWWYPMSKRQRARQRYAEGYMSRRYPASRWGRMYVKRGSEASLNTFGQSFKTATPAQKRNRENYRFIGQGKYNLKLGKFAKRNHLGQLALDSAMKYAGTGLYTGRGSYEPVSNQLVGNNGMPAASFSSTNDETDSMTFTTTEYIRDIYGNATGTNFSYQILKLQPGDQNTFPLGSSFAAQYEEYELLQCIFTFQSTISDQGLGNSNGQVGEVLMYTDYTPDNVPKRTKYELLQSYASSSSVTTSDQLHGVECDPAKIHGDGHKFIRVNPLDPGKSLVDYDWGFFQIAVSGTPDALANEIIGHLHVSYTMRFSKNRNRVGLGLNIPRDLFIAQTSYVDNQNPLSFPLIRTADSSIGCKVTQITVGTDQANEIVRVWFPAYFAGAVEITVDAERYISGSASIAAPDSLLEGPVVLTGNVFFVRDNYVALNNADDTPSPGAVCDTQGNRGAMAKIRVRVEQATSGTDNYITLAFKKSGTGSDHFTRGQIEIKRYNNHSSDEATPYYLDSNDKTAVLIDGTPPA